MERMTATYLSLNDDQRRGLLVIVIIAFSTSLCLGASCTAEKSLLMGAGLGGAAGFALAAVLIAALLRWGIDGEQSQNTERDAS